MLSGFKQLVPSEVCLKCDGCCRFRVADSPWRPKVGVQETSPTVMPKTMRKIFPLKVIDKKRYIKTLPYRELHICHFFAPQHNTCGIYPFRPFECQLYPFLLTGNSRRLAVGVHLLCPYVQANKDAALFNQYVFSLRNFFKRDDVRVFLKRNASLVTDYSQCMEEWEELFNFAFESGKGD